MLAMEDCGIEADALTSNLDFLYNGSSKNDVRSIDIDFDITKGEKGLELSGFNPEVRDSESSDDDGDDSNDLTRHVRQVCGNFSNEGIEKFYATTSSNSSKSDNKETLQAISNQLREGSERLNALAQAEPDDKPENTKKAKSKSRRFRNVAIESIMVIKSSPIQVTDPDPPTVPTVACESTVSNTPVSVKKKLTHGVGRGRGTLAADKSRKSLSMIRGECLHGIDSKSDYVPSSPPRNAPFAASDFPSL